MCSLITMQNSVVVSRYSVHTLRGPKILGDAGPPTVDRGVADPL